MRKTILLSFAYLGIYSCGEFVERKPKENISRQSQTSDDSSPDQARERLELNYSTELAQAKTPEEITHINRKYTLLNTILEHQINAFSQNPHEFIESNNPQEEIYKGPNFTASYHPLSLREVNRVFTDFGPLYVNETVDERGKPGADIVSVNRPWSGYWYPFDSNKLYDGEQAPLVKFDRLMSKLGKDSKSALREKQRDRGFAAAKWEGLCDAWSLAAVTTPEPTKGKNIHGIYFSVADLKALSTFSHLKYTNRKYGVPYLGNAQTDGTYSDIYPEAFHRIVEHSLGVEKKAVIIDVVPGVEVWNKPLFQYRWKIVKDTQTKKTMNVDAFLVDGWAWVVNHRQEEIDAPTSDKDVLAFNYKYRLYVDTKNVSKNKYRVIAGQWIEESIDDHPDTVTYAVKNGTLGSHNPEFNKFIDEYKTLFLD